jgi:potassium-dependent mechanosensitive channel
MRCLNDMFAAHEGKIGRRLPGTVLYMWLCVRMALLATFLAAGIASAQNQPQQNNEDPLANSDALIKRAEESLESGAASVAALETLRAQLATLRDANTAIVQRGSVGARALQAQLDALGPPPADGSTEAPEIADRRADLQGQMARANEPVRAAEEKLKQTQLLIGELDRMIRQREQERLLTRYPTPLSPAAWITTGKDMSALALRLSRETRVLLESPSNATRVRGVLPTVAALIGFALAFLLYFQPLVIRRLEAASSESDSRARRWTVLFAANLSRIVLPAIGAAAFLLVVPLLDLTPNSLATTAKLAPAIAIILIIAHWLGHTLFAPTAPDIRLLALDDTAAQRGLRLCQGLGLAIALGMLTETLKRDNPLGEATISVLSAPIIIAIALLLWRLAALFGKSGRAARAEADTESSTRQFDSGFLKLLSTLMRLSAVIAVVLIIFGYVELARYAAVPMVLTIAQFGLGLFLFHVIMAIFHAFVGKDGASEQDSMLLVPFGVIFLLLLMFTPLLALTWGARPTDIAEIWRLLTNGVQIGDIRLSLDVVITLVVVFILGAVVTRWLQRMLRLSILPRTRLDPGARTALVTGTGYVGLILSALIAVSTAGLNLSSLAVIFGALSVGIGFGLQAIVSNFVSGIILLVERPIKEGDWIEVSGYSGFVRKISVRSTRLETFDKHDVIIPNSDLITGTVKNMTLTSRTGRVIVPVGVAYGSDIEKCRSILLEIAQAYRGTLAKPEPAVLFMGLGDNSLDFEVRCFLRDVSEVVNAKSDMLFEIYAALGKAGIEIPFPQRDIHLKDIDKLAKALAGLSK